MSLIILLIYFGIVREENDLDRAMRDPIWDRVPGLERETLVALIEYNKKNSVDNTLPLARLAEITAEEKAGTAPSWEKFRQPKSAPPVIVVAAKPIA